MALHSKIDTVRQRVYDQANSGSKAGLYNLDLDVLTDR